MFPHQLEGISQEHLPRNWYWDSESSQYQDNAILFSGFYRNSSRSSFRMFLYTLGTLFENAFLEWYLHSILDAYRQLFPHTILTYEDKTSKSAVHSSRPGCHTHIFETPDVEREDGTYIVTDGDEVWETVLSIGLEPCLLEARRIGTSIDPDHHEEYISIFWLILPIGDQEYASDQEKIIHPINHYLFPEIYPHE